MWLASTRVDTSSAPGSMPIGRRKEILRGRTFPKRYRVGHRVRVSGCGSNPGVTLARSQHWSRQQEASSAAQLKDFRGSVFARQLSPRRDDEILHLPSTALIFHAQCGDRSHSSCPKEACAPMCARLALDACHCHSCSVTCFMWHCYRLKVLDPTALAAGG